MQQYKYKIQPLVEKGFDFNTIYPEKQEAVKEMSGYSFSIPEIVDFIKSQTNNFQQDNLVAFDLDDAIYKLYVKSTGGAKEAAAPTPAEAPAAPQGGDKADLENRLKILKKMFAKKPNDEDLKARVRTMEKRISKMADGGAVPYAKGGIFGDSQYNTGRSWHLDRYYHNTKEDWEKPMRKRKLKYFLGGGVGDIPVSEEKYSDMRDAVPPIYITTIDGHGVKNGFALGEAYSHAITPDGHKALYTAYYTFGDKYYQVADLVYFVGSGQAKTMENVADVEYAKGGGVSAKPEYEWVVTFTNGFRNEDIDRIVIAKNEDEAISKALENKLTKYGDQDYTIDSVRRLRYAKYSELNQYAKGGGVQDLTELNKEIISEKGFGIGDSIVYSIGEKGNILSPYREITGEKIISFKEKGKSKDLYVVTDKGKTVDYYAIINQYARGGGVEYAKGGGIGETYEMTDDTYVNVLLSRGFIEKRGSYGYRYFEHQPSGIFITYTPNGKEKRIVISKDKSGEITIYEGNSISQVLKVFDANKLPEIKEGIQTNTSSYAKGGGISTKTNYLSHRDIDHIETKSGKVIKGKDVVDGAYVKKRVKFADGGDVEMGDEPKVVRQIFEDTEELEYAGGGGVEKVYEVTQFDVNKYYDYILTESEAIAKFGKERFEKSINANAFHTNLVSREVPAYYLKYRNDDKYAGGGLFGGRPKSALMKDRAYKSDESWEKAYKRKKKPSNPRYKKKS